MKRYCFLVMGACSVLSYGSQDRPCNPSLKRVSLDKMSYSSSSDSICSWSTEYQDDDTQARSSSRQSVGSASPLLQENIATPILAAIFNTEFVCAGDLIAQAAARGQFTQELVALCSDALHTIIDSTEPGTVQNPQFISAILELNTVIHKSVRFPRALCKKKIARVEDQKNSEA